MKKLDLFILKSFFGPFIMTFFITVFILVMQFLWLYIDDLVGKGLSFWVIMEFLGWGSATILPLAMPLATLLASIMTFGNLGEANELLAMKAAGISLQRIFIPLIFVACFISVAAFFVSNDLIPLSYNKIYTLQYDIGKTKDEIKIPTGTFYNGIDGYSLRISSRNKKTDMMYDVMVYDHTRSKGNVALAVADSGLIRSTPDKKALIFTLYDGVSYEETNKVSYRDTSYALQQVDFSMQEVIIPLENYSFQKSEGDRYGNEIMAQDLEQLRNDRDSIGHLYETESLNQKRRIYTRMSMEYASQLDTVTNKGIVQCQNFPMDSIGKWSSLQEELDAVTAAIEHVQKAVHTLEGYDREILQYTFFLRRIDLESMRKFALSMACLIFFFIGAPLGAIIRKGGLGTPVIVSAFFFVLYWVVDISGKKLARDGVISPALGAFISTIVLLPIGVFLTWKSTKDSSLFNLETYMLPIKKFFKRMFNKDKKKKTDRGPRIVFMGTPDFAVASLKALLDGGYEVAGVVTVPDRKSGRGQKVTCSPVKEYILSSGKEIPLLQPEKLKDPDFLSALQALHADLFIVVAFRMLPKVVWSMPEMGTFNLHASLLPAYRGAAPINWALINGETETGVTTFLLDEQIDTGAVIFSRKIPILPEDNSESLHDRLMKTGAALVPETVEALVSRKVKLSPQDAAAETLPEHQKYAPKLTRETGHIDWKDDAENIRNLIRGLSPRPGAHSLLKSGEGELEMKIYSAVAVSDAAISARLQTGLPGDIETDGKSYIHVRCGAGVLSLLEIQAPGKKRMAVQSFLAGWRGGGGHFE